MTVDDSFSIIQHVAASSQTVFDGPFKIFQDTDLVVYQTPVGQTPNPSVDLLTLNVNYTITILDQSCSITLITPATAGDTLTLKREVPYARLDDYGVNGEFTGPSMDNNIDRLTVLEEQIRSIIEKQGLTYSDTDQLGEGDLKIPRLEASQFFQMNATRSGIQGVTIEENTNCSTLRSELANDQPSTDGSRIVGFEDSESGSITVHEKLIELEAGKAPIPDTTPVSKNAVDDTKLLQFDLSAISTGTVRKVFWPDRDVTFDDHLPAGYKWGLNIEYNTTVLLNITPGVCTNHDDQIDMRLSSVLVKDISVNWLEGSGNGGFPSSLSRTPNTWYHGFIISKTDGTVDGGVDADISASNLLLDAGSYSYFRYVGSVFNDASNNIREFNTVFVENGRAEYWWQTVVLNIEDDNPPLTQVTHPISVPPDITVSANINMVLEHFLLRDQGAALYVYGDYQPNSPPSSTVVPLCDLYVIGSDSPLGSIVINSANLWKTVKDQTLYYRYNGSAGAHVIGCALGWKEIGYDYGIVPPL